MKQYQIKAKLLSSAIHTEETNSNIANIFRERILKEDVIYDVPCIHGNSIRGHLRNIGAEHFLQKIEAEPNSLPTSLFHILFSGGALEKSEVIIDIMAKKKLRETVPFLSVFGSAVGDEMLDGKLIVSSGVPVCKELQTGNTSIYDMVQLIRYTRQDDTKKYCGEAFSQGNEITQQMFYDIECLIAGTELNFEIILKNPSEIEVGMMETVLSLFHDKYPYLGSKSSAGHGKIEFDFKPEAELIEKYNQYLINNKNEIKEYLAERFNGKVINNRTPEIKPDHLSQHVS